MGGGTKPESAPFDVEGVASSSAYPQPAPPQGPAVPPPAYPTASMPPPPATGAPVYFMPTPMGGVAPDPSLRLRPARVPPQPGQVIVGYEVYKYEPGCCQCEGLTMEGFIAVIVLVLLFWPLAWLPCVMPECFESYQRPVYGYPQQAPQYAAAPYSGYPQQPPQYAAAPYSGYPPTAEPVHAPMGGMPYPPTAAPANPPMPPQQHPPTAAPPS